MKIEWIVKEIEYAYFSLPCLYIGTKSPNIYKIYCLSKNTSDVDKNKFIDRAKKEIMIELMKFYFPNEQAWFE